MLGIFFVKVIFEMAMPCDLVTFSDMVKLFELVKVYVMGTTFEATPCAKETLSLEMNLSVKGIPFALESICGLETFPYDQEKPCDWGRFFDSVTISVMVTCGTESFALRGFSLGSSGAVKDFPSSAWTVFGLDWRHPAEPFQCALSCLSEESHPFLYGDHCENENVLDFFPLDQLCGLEKTFVYVSCCYCPGFC